MGLEIRELLELSDDVLFLPAQDSVLAPAARASSTTAFTTGAGMRTESTTNPSGITFERGEHEFDGTEFQVGHEYRLFSVGCGSTRPAASST